MPKHYWRIHGRISRRLLTDLPLRVREIIANDAAHITEEYKWFEAKVKVDAIAQFEDPTHYDNQEYTFRVPKNLRVPNKSREIPR